MECLGFLKRCMEAVCGVRLEDEMHKEEGSFSKHSSKRISRSFDPTARHTTACNALPMGTVPEATVMIGVLLGASGTARPTTVLEMSPSSLWPPDLEIMSGLIRERKLHSRSPELRRRQQKGPPAPCPETPANKPRLYADPQLQARKASRTVKAIE